MTYKENRESHKKTLRYENTQMTAQMKKKPKTEIPG